MNKEHALSLIVHPSSGSWAISLTNSFRMSAAEIEALLERASALNLVEEIDNGEKENQDTSIQVIGGKVVRDRRRKKSKKFSEQYLSHLVVIDFEATCWRERKASPNEIIEFPAVLYNLSRKKIEDEFHTYIRPSERPKLSPFCTELTGIEQETVDAGVNIKNALHKFQTWLIETMQKKDLVLPKFSEDDINGSVAFATWGDWDLGTCLRRELNRKSIKKPPYFNQWIDMRALYLKYYKYRPKNFTDSLLHLNMTFEGRAHSGICDARNLAHLCGRMALDGHLITPTTDLFPNKFSYRPFF